MFTEDVIQSAHTAKEQVYHEQQQTRRATLGECPPPASPLDSITARIGILNDRLSRSLETISRANDRLMGCRPERDGGEIALACHGDGFINATHEALTTTESMLERLANEAERIGSTV